MPTLTGVNIDRHQKLQKNVVTIEFTALDLCRVWNFIKIEAFAVLRPKLWPERRQVPTLVGVKNHRKLLPSMNSAPSNCSLCKILWKMVNLIPRSQFPIPRSPFPVPLFKNSPNWLLPGKSKVNQGVECLSNLSAQVPRGPKCLEYPGAVSAF